MLFAYFLDGTFQGDTTVLDKYVQVINKDKPFMVMVSILDGTSDHDAYI